MLYIYLKIHTNKNSYVTATLVKGLLILHPKLGDIIEPQTWGLDGPMVSEI